MPRRFKPPWVAERIPGGYVVKDATGQALAYVYACETKQQADTGHQSGPGCCVLGKPYLLR
jgi:hypothetical protein